MSINDVPGLIVAILTLLVTCLALYFAWRIPHQILVNQIYVDLVAGYRSYEMGEAIRDIFQFFNEKCRCRFEAVKDKYKKQYNKNFPRKCAVVSPPCDKHNNCSQRLLSNQPDYKDTLHAKRRLVDQYFWFVGQLAFGSMFPIHLPVSRLRSWFTSRERELLAIILKMDEAEEEINKNKQDEDALETYPAEKDGFMWLIRNWLFRESKHWRDVKTNRRPSH